MKNTLLAHDKTSMKALHDIYGFDYNKPYMIHEVNGSFTVNALEKIAAANGYNYINSVMACVLKPSTPYRENYLMTVKIDGCGGFDNKVGAHMNTLKHTTVDDYFRKSNFNEDRKKPGVVAWLICQKKEDCGKRYEWKKTSSYYYNRRPEYDKNGCNVTAKRSELKQKAAALRSERKKAEYLRMDNTVKLATLEKRLASVKTFLVDRLTAASTIIELDFVGNALSRWSGLPSLYRDFETLKTDDINRRFTSVDSFNSRYNRIVEGLEKIQPSTAETITAATYSDIA